jgi:Ca2+-binding EF-hand superfamily protein
MANKMGDCQPEATLRAAFQVFDNDGDGTISADEVGNQRSNQWPCLMHGGGSVGP